MKFRVSIAPPSRARAVMGMETNSDLACCRAMLAPRLCESAACTHELAWYGVTAEQKEDLKTLLRTHPHPSITPEIRRELFSGRSRGDPFMPALASSALGGGVEAMDE